MSSRVQINISLLKSSSWNLWRTQRVGRDVIFIYNHASLSNELCIIYYLLVGKLVRWQLHVSRISLTFFTSSYDRKIDNFVIIYDFIMTLSLIRHIEYVVFSLFHFDFSTLFTAEKPSRSGKMRKIHLLCIA